MLCLHWWSGNHVPLLLKISLCGRDDTYWSSHTLSWFYSQCHCNSLLHTFHAHDIHNHHTQGHSTITSPTHTRWYPSRNSDYRHWSITGDRKTLSILECPWSFEKVITRMGFILTELMGCTAQITHLHVIQNLIRVQCLNKCLGSFKRLINLILKTCIYLSMSNSCLPVHVLHNGTSRQETKVDS